MVDTHLVDVLEVGAVIIDGHSAVVLGSRHGVDVIDDGGQVARVGDVVRSVEWNVVPEGAVGGRR